jgi:MFS family permease
MAQALIIGWLFLTGHLSAAAPITSLIWVSVLGLAAGVVTALSFPAWQANIPDLVPRSTLLNAIALNSAQYQSARMLGPLAASALLLAGLGMADIFWINAASFLFVIAAIGAVHPHSHAFGAAKNKSESSWASLMTGVRYAVSHRIIGIVIVSTAIMTLVGMPYLFLLPSVADKVLGFKGAELQKVYTYLMAANGFGALVGALVVASLPHSIRRERLMRWSILTTALLLIVFAFTPWLWVSLILSALTGAGVLTTNSLANTSIQSNVPNRLRGRVMSLFIMSFLGIMPLSAIVFGPLAKALGPTAAIAGGATLLLVWALVLIARPSLLTHNE